MTSRNVAIIGAGIGGAHLDAYLDLEDRFHVHTICDLEYTRAQALQETATTSVISTDMHAAIRDPAVDIVDVCLPPHLHFEACAAALDAGKHVICEKPLVTSLHECDRLIEKSAHASGNIFPVFQYRYGIGASRLRALIDAQIAGKPFVCTLETHWNRGKDYYAVEWRGTWSGERGGAVLGHAIHIHDWLTYMLGPVQSVYAELATRVNDIEVEDCAALALRMCNGALVTSSITLGAADNTSRLRFCFENLTAESGRAPYAPAEDEWTFTAREPAQQADVDALIARVRMPKPGYAGLFEAIADCLDGKPGREVTLEDARRSLEFVSAVYHSARTAIPVSLPLGADHMLYDGWVPSVSG